MLLQSGPSDRKLLALEHARAFLRFRLAITALAAGTIGLLASQGTLVFLPVSLFLFALLSQLHSYKQSWFCAAIYYAAATWTMLPGAAIFYGHTFHPLRMVLLWGGISLLLAAPWTLLTAPRRYLPLTVCLCLILETIPPLALIGVANPLTAAGLLFPHTAWIGLLFLAALAILLSARPLLGSVVLVSLLPLSQLSDTIPPKDWATVTTAFGGQGLDTLNLLRDYRTGLSIQQRALNSTTAVTIFPESVLSNWTPATDLFWGPTLARLARDHKTVVIGAHLPNVSSGYSNALIIRGNANTLYQQRIPIPVSMWNPLRAAGAPLRLSGPSVLALHGQRPAFFLCYEELLPWLYLQSFAERPTILIGASNQYWARPTVFPNVATASMKAWAHLFNVPFLLAVNQ